MISTLRSATKSSNHDEITSDDGRSLIDGGNDSKSFLHRDRGFDMSKRLRSYLSYMRCFGYRSVIGTPFLYFKYGTAVFPAYIICTTIVALAVTMTTSGARHLVCGSVFDGGLLYDSRFGTTIFGLSIIPTLLSLSSGTVFLGQKMVDVLNTSNMWDNDEESTELCLPRLYDECSTVLYQNGTGAFCVLSDIATCRPDFTAQAEQQFNDTFATPNSSAFNTHAYLMSIYPLLLVFGVLYFRKVLLYPFSVFLFSAVVMCILGLSICLRKAYIDIGYDQNLIQSSGDPVLLHLRPWKDIFAICFRHAFVTILEEQQNIHDDDKKGHSTVQLLNLH
eukprot:GHVH01015332.1.p2 GENE.GHVH01015332.1~~GHVH01015332.1.p2  ORF type:complete len:334 (+),score=30.48 GHVH01015332.1:35-1036(+)